MNMTLEQLHDWITRLPEPFRPVKRQTDAIEAAIRERDRLRGDVDGLRDCVMRASAELDALRNIQSTLADEVTQKERAEAELAALKARIAGAPLVEIANIGDPFIVLPDHFTVPHSLKGKTVRLVVEE